MPGRRGGYVVGAGGEGGGVWAVVGVRAAVWQLMLSAGGDFTAELGRPPVCPEERYSGMLYHRNMQHDENSVNRGVV